MGTHVQVFTFHFMDPSDQTQPIQLHGKCHHQSALLFTFKMLVTELHVVANPSNPKSQVRGSRILSSRPAWSV